MIPEARRRASTWSWAAIVLVALAYGWWAVALPPFSTKATAAVVGAGVVVMAVVARGRPSARGGGRTVGAGWWVALIGLLAAWQLAAYLQDPREDHPTLSSLANAILDTHPARAGAFVLWIIGAVLLARR